MSALCRINAGKCDFSLLIVLLRGIQAIVGTPFNTYDVDNHPDGQCLSYRSRKDQYCEIFCPDRIEIEQIRAYCLRSVADQNSAIVSSFETTTNRSVTFVQLKVRYISSETLLSWSASIDMAERFII